LTHCPACAVCPLLAAFCAIYWQSSSHNRDTLHHAHIPHQHAAVLGGCYMLIVFIFGAPLLSYRPAFPPPLSTDVAAPPLFSSLSKLSLLHMPSSLSRACGSISADLNLQKIA
jgi:hypothetical protein